MEQWPSKACRDKNIRPAVTMESLCPAEAQPVISHHTEAEALTPRPSDPVSPPSVTTFPVSSTKNPAIATRHPFPPQEVFGGTMLLHTPLCICLALCRGHSEANSLAHLCPLGRDVHFVADVGAVCQDHSCLPRLFLSSVLPPQGTSK